VDVSSTDVRERLRAGKPIRYLTPEPVEAYIAKHGLYAPLPE
jgi:nicotinate-nucleotide adenylyltransferase